MMHHGNMIVFICRRTTSTHLLGPCPLLHKNKASKLSVHYSTGTEYRYTGLYIPVGTCTCTVPRLAPGTRYQEPDGSD